MKKHRSSQFLAICTAAVLALSVPAWASQVSITPLDTGNTTSSQSQSGASEPSTAQNTSGQTVDISSITKPTVASQGAVLLNAADGSVLFFQEWGYNLLPCQHYQADDRSFSSRKL